MKPALSILCLLVLTSPLAGCKRSLDEEDVRQFVDQADQAARKRYAPEICELRAESFTLALTFQSIYDVPPSELNIDRKLYCRMAGRFSQYRQYRLERRSLAIDVAEDAKTATVVAEYIETMPYYEDSVMPATPDDFRHFVVVESHDESVVGIDGGDLAFLSAKVEATQTELIEKSKLDLPYD
jgi:hypothetical protein